MVTARRGASSLGCLVTLLVVVAIAYFGANAAEVYIRYYRYRDAMNQAVRFAAHTTDASIRRDLRAFADSLGLPDGAQNVTVRRGRGIIAISSDYYEQIELPLMVREVHLNPHAEGPL